MILLISETPVAGTVYRTARWIEKLLGKRTISLVKNNYKNNVFSIPNGTFGCLESWASVLSNEVMKSNIIFIHNIVNKELLDIIFNSKKKSAKIFYQYHSPPLEAPQYNYESIREYDYDLIFSVAQGYGRFIENSILVPNIIPDFLPDYKVSRSNSIIVPHMRSTEFRWSNKFSKTDYEKLESSLYLIKDYNLSSIKSRFDRDFVTHEEILLLLNSTSFVIDDINTGLMHQTTFESIKAGCIVFSAADLISLDEFCRTIKSPMPPMISVGGIDDVIRNLTNKYFLKSTPLLSSNALDFGRKYLDECRLANIYVNILKKNINII